MNTYFNTLAAAALVLTAAAPSFADSQLSAGAGLSPSEAAGLSLTEVAQAKFNRDTRSDDRHVIVASGGASPAAKATLAANAGLSAAQAQDLSLSGIAAVKFNRETRPDDHQTVRGQATMATRSIAGNSRAQLVSSAGLGGDQAAGLSLTEIAQAKFDRDTQN